jgi:putative DNA primase/helicase
VRGKEPVYYSELIEAHAKSSEGSNRLGCIANLAKAFPEIAAKAEDFDRDREAINVLNGTIVLVPVGNHIEARLRRHDPADMISKVANVEYDPDAGCEEYRRLPQRGAARARASGDSSSSGTGSA